ncbi:uncharacterized protein N7482_004562 [Penicillium canariense]|uniref:Uncharacterized protein n=1 Tax=Penicillium canariense TaxID=189055 RepID=A0A9W9LQM4_9EURO|nr:uncharacterized protein N7482_004562 [Penicillium canariense]KAJ5168968.1 hypothetical protein N7482_004562 [Penicillium canariense]
MDRVRRLLADPVAYEPLEDSAEDDAGEHGQGQQRPLSRFSRLEYSVFFLLGVAMLWAWNMFLAAAPYFYSRFESNDWTATHYQSSILSVSTVTNLGTVYILATIQKQVSYPWRITLSLLMNCFIFTLLAFSTIVMKDISAQAYFGFLMVMVFGASFATGLNQNGVFAYVSGYGREEYTQAIMGGQGVAGVLPCIVQIFSVLAVPRKNGDGQGQDGSQGSSSKSAFIYFLTATGVSVLTLLTFLYLLRNRPNPKLKATDEDEGASLVDRTPDKAVSLWTLFKKLRYLSLSVFVCFLVTMMFFPVFTSEIQSVHFPGGPRMSEPTVFIPLAFLFWNIGDLGGRLAVAIPKLSLAHRPWMAFVLAVARVIFVPLYVFCNINGNGAVVKSDFFYLFIVQLFFGATNGYLASSCMMGASHWVTADEREAAGGFMSMMLVGGLAAGSLLSFLVVS